MSEGEYPSISAELVARIQAGDHRALEALYLQHRDKLLFTIRCRLGLALRRRLESEDVLHSVFRDVIGDLHGFEHRGEGSLEHFLHVCTLNKIRNKAAYFAAKKRAGAVPLSPSLIEMLPNAPDQPPTYSDSESYEKLERALTALPEHLREVVLLRTVEGLSNSDAAIALKRSPEATTKLYNRAVARLARLVDGWSGESDPTDEPPTDASPHP